MSHRLFLKQRLSLQRGEVIAYPTESVWGLGCSPNSEQGLQRLLSLKQRDWRKGLLLVAADIKQLHAFVDFDVEQERSLQQYWPGPITFVFRHNQRVSDLVSGGRDTVAVRVSAHPVVRALCTKLGILVSTSANISGSEPVCSQFALMRQFGFTANQIVTGSLGGANSVSAIIDWHSGKRLR